MIHHLRSLPIVAIISLFAAAPLTAAESSVVRRELTSGVSATIYSADYLAHRVTPTSESRGILRLDDGSDLGVITDIGDALIHNKGDGSFHRYELQSVLDALYEIDLPGSVLDVEILVLPFPRADVLVSSANGNRIFLSPQVVEISTENAAYVVAHEMGHVFQHRYLPEFGAVHGAAYRRLRGIDDAERYHASAAHADRPTEIFAEDFRVLFGGPRAHFGGRIENSEIASPAHVPGLDDFFRSLVYTPATSPIVSVSSYPNPFNPNTELRVALDPEIAGRGEAVAIRIYDVRGALVRELFAGQAGTSQIRVRWDGRDHGGRDVASAMYFGVVDFAGTRKTQKLLLVK